MKTSFSTFLVLMLALFIWACHADNEEDLFPEEMTKSLDSNKVVSYSMEIEPIINAKCATSGCHVAGGTGNGHLTNYNEVKLKVDNGSLRNRVLNDPRNPMPPSGALPNSEKDLIRLWLDQGAKNN